jgi:sulfatase modifying factor 1
MTAVSRNLVRATVMRSSIISLSLLLWCAGCADDRSRAERHVAERDAHVTEIARLHSQGPMLDQSTLVTMATHQWAAGLYDDAQRSFERALAISEDPRTRKKLAALLYQRGRYLQAAEMARVGRTSIDASESLWLHELLGLVDVSTANAAGARNAATPDGPDAAVINTIGMTLVSVPGATFNRGDASGDADQQPVRSISVSPYRIGAHEVTVGQFKMFLDETDYTPVARTNPAFAGARDTHPAYGIAWTDAVAFTIWLSAREQAAYRLPTEAEWEFAARGQQGRRDPWGDEAGRPQVDGNWGRTSLKDLRAIPPPTEPVGTFPRDRSPFGLFDVAGNVREWCLDDYDATYYAWSPERDPYGPAEPTGAKVLRGGAWNHPGPSRFAVTRSKASLNQSYTGYGFRVVRETVK